MRFGADGGYVKKMGGFHVRCIVKAADESVGRNVHGAFDVAVAAQGEIRKPAIAGRHAKLQGYAGGRHRQIESMLELNFLRLSETELAGDIGYRLLRKHDRARSDGADAAGKLNVFDGLGETLKAAAILFKKAQARPIDLTVNQQTYQTLVPAHPPEGQLALRAIETRHCLAEPLAMNARHVLVRRLAHRGVIPIDVERPHGPKI